MRYNILDQKITDISEFHDYLSHTLIPSAAENTDDIYNYEKEYSQREKLSLLVVRNSSAFERYTEYLRENKSEDFLDAKKSCFIKTIANTSFGSYLELLEKLSDSCYLVFYSDQKDLPLEKLYESEKTLYIWNSERENKNEVLERLWKDKNIFYIIKYKYLPLFKNISESEKIVFKDVKNFFDSISFMGIISENGNTIIMLSALNDIKYVINAMIK